MTRRRVFATNGKLANLKIGQSRNSDANCFSAVSRYGSSATTPDAAAVLMERLADFLGQK
jgi:hypothetical protein